MPTSNPRITITLTPSVYAQLRSMSEVTGDSMSSLVSGFLELASPVFGRVTEVMRLAAQIQEEAPQELADSLKRSQEKLEAQLGLALEALDEGSRPLLDQAEGIRRRSAGAGGGRRKAPTHAPSDASPTPVPVTRGSGHPSKGRKGGQRG